MKVQLIKESKLTENVNEIKLITLYFRMIQLYFKLVDKLEGGMTVSSWLNFKNVFKNKISEILVKMNVKSKQISEKFKVKLYFYDTCSNSIDLDDFVTKINNKDWNISNFLNQSGVLFNLKIEVDQISDLIQKSKSSKIN